MNDADKFDRSAMDLEAALAANPVIRAVNFHSTPKSRIPEYREQLSKLSAAFSPVTEDDLDQYLATGRWLKPKPGVIISVYEGYRNGFDVMLPLLEEFGLVGWFFIITGFLKTPPSGQLMFATSHSIDMATQDYADGRYALSWDELRQIDRRHVVASHARNHVWIDTLDASARESEVIGSQQDLTEKLGHPVRSFVSYGGPAYGVYPSTDPLIDAAGYQFVFSNMKIQRLRAAPAKG